MRFRVILPLRRTALFGFWVSVAVCTTSPAFAEPVDRYSYEFEADFLDGDDLAGAAPRLQVRAIMRLYPLIRPRTSYVTELLKSVENL